MKKFFSFIWEVSKIVIIASMIVFPVRYFLFQPFFVKGESMEPTFENGDYLIVNEISYRFESPKRGEVIVFKYPEDPSQRFIKRIIGLPGETVEIKDGKVAVYKNGKTQILNESNYLNSSLFTQGDVRVSLGKDEYFVMGDNRPFSYDSRRFGVVPAKDIIGRVALRALPFASFTKFKAPAY
jgi:signal peptidase I